MSLSGSTLYNQSESQRLEFDPTTTIHLQDATDISSALLIIDQQLDDQNEAVEISYDNSSSGLVATTMQGAIDEVELRVDTVESSYAVTTLTSAAAVATEYESNLDTNKYSDAEKTKLAGIETGATADQTAGEIKTLYESNANTNAFSDSEKTKLAGIETGATADQTAGEIKTLYESNVDTNVFSDTEQLKLAGIETGATADQISTEVPFTTTTTLVATNVRDAIEEVFAAETDDQTAAEVPYDNTTSGLTATEVQSALDEIAANTGAGPMQTQIKSFSESIGLYYGSSLLSSATANRDPKSIYLRDSNFKVDLTEGKWLITYQLATGPLESLYYLSGTLTADEATIEANSITQTFHQGRDPFGGAIIVDVSTPTSYTIWTIPPSNQNGRFFEGTNIGPSNPDQVATISAVRLSAPSVGDASAVVYSNTTSGLTATNAQAAIDEVEGRLDTAETDIDNLEAIVGQETSVANSTFLGRASAPAVPNALHLPSAGVGGALADSSSSGASSRAMLYDTSSGRLFPISIGVSGACLQNQSGFISMQKPLSQFVDFNTGISSLSSTNARDAIEEVNSKVVTLEGATHVNSLNGQSGTVALQKISTQSGTFTPSESFDIYVLDTSGGAVTVNLPEISTLTYGNYKFVFKDNGNASVNNITINRAGSDVIDGDTSVVITTDYSSITITADNANWWII